VDPIKRCLASSFLNGESRLEYTKWRLDDSTARGPVQDLVEIYHRNLATLNQKAAVEYPVDEVKNTPSWPRRWANLPVSVFP
jgi:hypothetical protein